MRKKIIITALTVISAAVLIVLAVYLVHFLGINKTSYTAPEMKLPEALEEIEIGSSNVLVAESENRNLYINPESLNVILEDKETGTRFQSVLPSASNALEKSLLIVNYVGKDNKFYEWDSFSRSVETESYSISRIENGVRVYMNFNEGASGRFYEYLPQKMSVEHYDLFKTGLERAVEDGVIDEKQKKKYLSTLSLVYKKSKQDVCYNCTYVGNPPMSACKQLIAMTELVGYTRDMLLEDADTFGFNVEFVEPAVFNITMDFTLEGDELVANIPVSLISSENDYYTITNIEMLPNFGLVTQTDAKEGYLLIPDGSGALMKMNTYNAKVPDYKRPVYNNDYYKDYLYTPEYTTEIMMPVFGIILKETENKPYSVLGIIESGEDYASIEAMLAASGEQTAGRNYNKVYASFDYCQYENVPVFGEFSSNTTTYLSVSPASTEDFTVRYRTYPKATDYYEIATDYREYLFGTKEGNVYHDSASLFLELYGTLSTTERFLGIPYNSRYVMTSYIEALEILKSINASNMNVSYLGAFDGGKDNMLMNRGKLVKKNGSASELDELESFINGKNGTLYLGTDFMRVWDTTGNGFTKAVHGNEDYTKEAVTVYGTNKATGIAWDDKFSYSILKPSYLEDCVNDFLKNTNRKQASYYVSGLSDQYYADYGNDYTSPVEAGTAIDNAMEKLSGTGTLALDNPRADKVSYGSVMVDIPRDSSEYAVFYCTIPFTQLVYNGMCEYTTVTANNNSMEYDFYLMQALETGAELKFTLSEKSVDVLRDTEYSYLYSIQYSLLKDDIKETVDKFEEAMKTIGKSKIMGHRIAGDNVFITEYESGVLVYTNYNGLEKTVGDVTIPAYGYVVCR